MCMSNLSLSLSLSLCSHRNFGKTSHVRPKEASHVRVTAAAAMYNSLKNADINVTSNSYGESNIAVSLRDVKEAPHDGGTFLWKTSPIGSTSCFGDFCCFEEYAVSVCVSPSNLLFHCLCVRVSHPSISLSFNRQVN